MINVAKDADSGMLVGQVGEHQGVVVGGESQRDLCSQAPGTRHQAPGPGRRR